MSSLAFWSFAQGKIITNVTYAFQDEKLWKINKKVDERTWMKIAKWSAPDPRTLAQLGKDELAITMDDVKKNMEIGFLFMIQGMVDIIVDQQKTSDQAKMEKMMIALKTKYQTAFNKNLVQSINAKKDMIVTSLIGMYKTSQLVGEKMFQASNSAITLVRYVIGTFIGFSVVSKLFPFALAVTAGVNKGTKGFAKMTEESKSFEVPGDKTSIEKFNALLLFVSGAVTAVPMITVTIFFYQSYADQYFIFVVFGMNLYVSFHEEPSPNVE